MIPIKYLVLTLSFIVLSMLPMRATALTDVPVDPGAWTGSISSATGNVIVTQDWAVDGFKISWNISQEDSTFHYIYTITDAAGGDISKSLSHLILQVSDSFTLANITNGEGLPLNPSTPLGTFTPSDPSNPGLPGNIYGLKFDGNDTTSGLVIDFYSDRAPVWGDFYAKDGVNGQTHLDVYAYNAGFGLQPTADYLAWIPRPDTAAAVPEPATWMILGSSLAALMLAKKRRNKDLKA